MPSPLGHALGGLTVHLLTARDRDDVLSWSRALTVVGASVAADLDLLLKLVDGQNHHQGISHSIGVAVLAGLLVALGALWARAGEPWTLGALAALGWASHLFLDYLGDDTHPPIGLPALWPLTEAYLKFPWPVFASVGRTLELTTIRNNVVAVAWELVVLLPIPALLLRRRLKTS